MFGVVDLTSTLLEGADKDPGIVVIYIIKVYKLLTRFVGLDAYFWPNLADRLSIAGCRAGKVADYHDRLLPTQSGR